jgi:hypothetical protein
MQLVGSSLSSIIIRGDEEGMRMRDERRSKEKRGEEN